MTSVLIRRGNLDTNRQRGDHMREKTAICKPRREASEETNPPDIFILYFQPPEL